MSNFLNSKKLAELQAKNQMSNFLNSKKLARLNVKRVFNSLKKNIEKDKDAFKVSIKYSQEASLNIKRDENLHLAWNQAISILQQATNGEKFYFEDFGFDPKNMIGIDRINITSFILAQYMFSDSPIFDNCEIFIRIGSRLVQHEFKARLLSYIYTLACYYIKNPNPYTIYDWKWEKSKDLIHVYCFDPENEESENRIANKPPKSTRSVLFRIDNEVFDELISEKLCEIPQNMFLGNYDYEKFLNFAKIRDRVNCPETRIREARAFYFALIHLKLDLPTFKGYLPKKIIEYIMQFVTVKIAVVLTK